MSGKMQFLKAFIVISLVAALVVAPASAAGEGGILQGIFDWFAGWLPSSTPSAPPAVYSDDGSGLKFVAPPCSGKEPPDPKDGEGRSDGSQDIEIGEVFAIDYFTVPPYGSAPLMILFSANEEVDGYTVDQYAWDFGDGFSSTERDHFHSYKIPGAHTATLTVTNSSTGWTTSAQVPIYVEPPGAVPLPPRDEEWEGR